MPVLLLLYSALVAVSSVHACKDRAGAPIRTEGWHHLTCADYAGACNVEALTDPIDQARLFVHCPQTCSSTPYQDGSGEFLCTCQPGVDCCVDDLDDCSQPDSV